MEVRELNVYVITRFGLGQSQESFYEREFFYLKNFLAESINKQKKYIKKWIILIDAKTPQHIIQKIKKLASQNLIYVYIHDPFLTGTIMPKIKTVLYCTGTKLNDRVVTIRIDADDIFSNDYISNVLNALNSNNLKNKYDKVLVDTASGIYFYPLNKKLIRVIKKGFSIQAIYSIFNKDFFSVYDCAHQKLKERIIDQRGYYCILRHKDFWIRLMRQHSVTRFGKKIRMHEGRFILIKKILKKIFKRSLSNSTNYKETVGVNSLSNRFPLSNEIIEKIKEHEKDITKYEIKYSSKINQIINSKKVKSPFTLKEILLKKYQQEGNEAKKLNIKKDFYSF